MKSEEDFKKALIGKKVPLLVLDQKWHRLFAENRSDKRDRDPAGQISGRTGTVQQ